LGGAGFGGGGSVSGRQCAGGEKLLEVLQKAVAALPPSVPFIRVHSDLAAYVHELLDWCREPKPGRARIDFAIITHMSAELQRAAIEVIPEYDKIFYNCQGKRNKNFCVFVVL
jgi:hypothetical protein